MTTLIIHGTLAGGATWYKSSWSGRGFLAGLRKGMIAADGSEDIWTVNGERIDNVQGLGTFKWSGSHEGSGRGYAAIALVNYLNQLHEITDEPIRIIAHSHGCNVVKLASSLPDLAASVFIDQAVFLACPHFSEVGVNSEPLADWKDSLSFKKLAEHNKDAAPLLRYAINPNRFRRILNLYSKQDVVQVPLAQAFGATTVPMTGSFWNNFKAALVTGITEYPTAARRDIDPNARHLYDDLELEISGQGTGLAAHSALHGYEVGAFCGDWLNTGLNSQQIIANAGALILSYDDLGG
jgi:hypothetical protein